MPEGQTQKESPGFSFLMSYTSRSPGLNLFDSSIFDSEMSSEQVIWEAKVLFLKKLYAGTLSNFNSLVPAYLEAEAIFKDS